MNIEAVRLPTDIQCDLSDMVNEKHPGLSAELQDTILRLVEFSCDAQTRHLIELGWGPREEIEKQERSRMFKQISDYAEDFTILASGHIRFTLTPNEWNSLKGD